ncbi:hypothetical protein RND71_021804 [Anisodus tanguticus]|uniref:Uncharacterized protein n=1 Tax=Anisodus tanguticus TaxID=243964 RepID=A0AAE1VGG5_9SOLA|nr:hypothetical protein RND71_021804 [Anisodus tanguticus]
MEVTKFWSPKSEELLTGDMLKEMKYVEVVAFEVLRFRPPTPMVPHLTSEDTYVGMRESDFRRIDALI